MAKALAALQADTDVPRPQVARDAGITPGAFGGEVLRDDETSR